MPNGFSSYDPREVGKVVGEFKVNDTIGFENNFKEVSESFSQDGFDVIKDFGSIISSKPMRERYKEKISEDVMFNAIPQNRNMSATDAQFFELQQEMYDQVLTNGIDSLVSESQSVANLNPFVALTAPIIKREWLETFYRYVVETVATDKPVVNREFERAYLMDDAGKKYYFPEATYSEKLSNDLWSGLSRPVTSDKITLPAEDFDIIQATTGASRKQRDSLNHDIAISKIYVEVESGKPVVEKVVNIKPNIEYGTFFQKVEVASGKFVTISGILMMREGKLSVHGDPSIKQFTLSGSLSSENNLKSASVGWERDHKQIKIGTKPHLNTGLTKETIKNEKALYDIDAVSKTIDLMVKVLNNFRDYEIKKYLDDSLKRNKGTQWILESKFNCIPIKSFHGTPEEYVKKRLMDKLEKMSNLLTKILHTPNIYFKVFANSFNMRLIESEVEWVMGDLAQNNGTMGGIKLEYSLGVTTKQHKYHFISSDRVPVEDGFRILVMPLDGMHKTFTHYDYAFFLENDYRDPNNSGVPSVMATAMYEIDEIFPIQGHIEVINNTLDDPDSLWA